MEQYLLGIDIGTQTSKGILFTTEGRVVAQSNAEHATIMPQPGWMEHDADKAWWGDLLLLTRDILNKSNIDTKKILAIGVSGCTPNMLLLDSHDHPLRNAILYSDNRAISQLENISKETGSNRPAPLVSKLLWVKDNEPDLWSKAGKILGTYGYMVYRLTGVYTTDHGGSLYPLYDDKKKTWDEDMCRRLGIPVGILPEPHTPVEVVGKVTREAAAQTGLAEGIPVICGGADAYAETLSTAVTDVSEGAVLYSTLMLVGRLKPKGAVLPFVIPAPSIPEHYNPPIFINRGMASSGSLVRWYRDNFGGEEVDIEKRTGINAYQLLDMEAEKIRPGSEGLVVLPHFNGERAPIHDPDARGLIVGLALKHTRLHIYHALLEGIAYGFRHILESMTEYGIKMPTRLRATGGGTQSRLWTQIVSDVTGISQDCVEGHYGSPLGMAFMAGIGIGLFKDFREIKDWVKVERVVQPREEYKPVYDKHYEIYRGLYEKNKTEMHELKRLS